MGFEADEGMLDYPGRSFLAYRMLQEFFSFPEKFFFLELGNLAPILAQGFQNEFEVIFLISRIDSEDTRLRLENGVAASTFCTSATQHLRTFSTPSHRLDIPN